MLTRSLALLLGATILQSCVSSPTQNSGPVIPALPLQHVFEHREALSGQRVTIEGFLFSDKNGATLKRSDQERSRIRERDDSCPRNSEADLLVLESALMLELHRTPGAVDMVLPEGRATSEFRRANRHRVVVSGLLRDEKTDLNLRIITIEYDGRLDDARLEYVYEDQCRDEHRQH